MQERPGHIGLAVRNTRQVEVRETCQSAAAAQVRAVGGFEIEQQIGGIRQTEARVQSENTRGLGLAGRRKAVRPAVRRPK